METNLHFTITTTNGSTIEQDIKVPTEAIDNALNQVLAQYSTVGLLKKDVAAGRYTLIPANQIALITCDTKDALVVSAAPSDVAKVAAASKGLTRIK